MPLVAYCFINLSSNLFWYILVAQKILNLKEHSVQLGDCTITVQAKLIQFLVPSYVEVMETSWIFRIALCSFELMCYKTTLSPHMLDGNTSVPTQNLSLQPAKGRTWGESTRQTGHPFLSVKEWRRRGGEQRHAARLWHCGHYLHRG